MSINFEKTVEQLLDLSRNNKLINYRDIKLRTMEIVAPDYLTIYARIRSGQRLNFYDLEAYLKNTYFLKEPKAKDNQNQELALNLLFEDQTILKTSPGVINDSDPDEINSFEEDNRLKVKLPPKSELIKEVLPKLKNSEILAYKPNLKYNNYRLEISYNKILATLAKVAKESLTEKGINILYLAVGFLRWYDTETNYWNNSPINLIPIVLDINSTNKTYYIQQYEEEVFSNPTLLYKLKTGNNIELPPFTNPDELDDYFNQIRNQVSGLGWEVNNEMVIGTFSFLKMNMYEDLKQNKDLILQNQVISKLFGTELSNNLLSKKSNDKIAVITNSELHNVVDADASQVEAILSAKNGNSFVLQGPPGTGKSQTITNIIAEFLHDQKSILFVSEKLTALSIVHNNLKKVGLADYCLELHSNKVNKKAVIETLYKALGSKLVNLTADAINQKELLAINKAKLDKYQQQLHQVDPVYKISIYQLYQEIIKRKDIADLNYLIDGLTTNHKKTSANQLLIKPLELLTKFKDHLALVGKNYWLNPWYGFTKSKYDYQNELSLKKTIDDLDRFLDQINLHKERLTQLLGVTISDLEQLKTYLEFIEIINQLGILDDCLYDPSSVSKLAKDALEINQLENKLTSYHQELTKTFGPDFETIEFKKYHKLFTVDYRSLFRIFNRQYRDDKVLLSSSYRGQKPNYRRLLVALNQGCKYLEILDMFNQKVASFDQLLIVNHQKISWSKLSDGLSKLSEVVTFKLKFKVELDLDLINHLQQAIIYENDLKELIKQTGIKQRLLQNEFDSKIIDFNQLTLDQFTNKIKEYLEQFNQLNNWISFNRLIEELEANQILPLIKLAIDKNCDLETIDQIYLKAYYQQLLSIIKNQTPTILDFNYQTHENAVKIFKEKDKLGFKIAIAEIASILSQARPHIELDDCSGQAAILRKEAAKKRRQMSVRSLFKVIPDLILKLKPCIMMSPLSVSTYLDSNQVKFDVVIFDEASQIFPWDAIGAIYRAKQMIVVGDSKQMPPSNFFVSGLTEGETEVENDEELADDYESILDLSNSVYRHHCLKWHYRSKIEELIAFSNQNFYDDSLITFPQSQMTDDDGVQFYYVENGIYRRNTRNNYIEALKVVDLIYQHFETTPQRSLGVVAFSASQQELIEALLSKRRDRDDRYYQYFIEDSENNTPFFIKNLETIQGDERDTIIFSVGYGKDENGKFLHLFGPLNKVGGERRLNVAITRAKYCVKLVSSIRSGDIDLNKTKALGSALLKKYLEYAEYGIRAVNSEQQMEINDSLVDQIALFLTDLGYRVDRLIGQSEYKIAIGVKHPDNDNYLVAIETDGFNYQSIESTRDRDRLRPEILEVFGWRFYRVWSTSWFANPDSERKRLVDFIKKAVDDYDRGEFSLNADLSSDQDLIDNQVLIKDSNLVQSIFNPTELNPTESIQNDLIQNYSNRSDQLTSDDFLVNSKQQRISLNDVFSDYVDANLDKISRLYPLRNKTEIQKIIREIIRIEQPIAKSLLIKKLAKVLGKERITDYVKYELSEMINSVIDCYKINNYYFLDKNLQYQFRYYKDGRNRDITTICDQELASGILKIVELNLGINSDDIISKIANLLGYKRISSNIQVIVLKVIASLVDKKQLIIKDSGYFIKT